MRVNTRNVAAFRVETAIFRKFEPRPYSMEVDGQEFKFVDKDSSPTHYYLTKGEADRWTFTATPLAPMGTVKAGGTSMDDAFVSRFIVVLPEGPGHSDRPTKWATSESARFLARWRSLMRGDAIVKKASQITPEELFVEGAHRQRDHLRWRGTEFGIPYLGEPGSDHPDGIDHQGQVYGSTTWFPVARSEGLIN
jgi:hypothetical protein